ncbi:hypothetical protein VINE108521_15360 [Vibrio neonatus]
MNLAFEIFLQALTMIFSITIISVVIAKLIGIYSDEDKK